MVGNDTSFLFYYTKHHYFVNLIKDVFDLTGHVSCLSYERFYVSMNRSSFNTYVIYIQPDPNLYGFKESGIVNAS